MKSLLSLTLFLVMINQINAQELTYYEIPEPSDDYTAGSIASRIIDGLGFRYYWATEGLTDKDLSFKPTEESRSAEETIDHILGLSQVILNAAIHKPNGGTQPKMTFHEKREKTLKNLKKASNIINKQTDLSAFKVVFGDKELPFWNVLNGPVADAIWHCGQIVSFRRSSGNPLPKGISFLTGKVNR